MQVEQSRWNARTGWDGPLGHTVSAPQLVFVFGGREQLSGQPLDRVFETFPGAQVMGCSTAGEISGVAVSASTVAVTAIEFESSTISVVYQDVESPEASAEAGANLMEQLPSDGLRHVFVLSEGVHVNGSALVAGMETVLPGGIGITGGLAGDGDAFERTVVLRNGAAEARIVSAVGLYGDSLRIGQGCRGGWSPFGPAMTITSSEANVLYSLDGVPALDVYRSYLGDRAVELPAAGLALPVGVQAPGTSALVVRTLLSTNPDDGSIVFAGEMPQQSSVRFMRGKLDHLIGGAREAAAGLRLDGERSPQLAIVVSCTGRRLLLKQRVEEEIEEVRCELGADTKLTGFYSYGEIAVGAASTRSELHNQTLTITTVSED
ncbi:MAG: FIST C-terminal domain-containing protein [Gemmatimonadota bacterium]|nr:FIST C-terminal domain-containing protein [Gemmatimonadota bacterium]MDH3426831.1 FIST C-terminal domain-containing protein [Gemmatimonadota bacterium]